MELHIVKQLFDNNKELNTMGVDLARLRVLALGYQK